MTYADVREQRTAWESVATTRWGRYTTEVVEDAIRTACDLAGTPGPALEVGCEGGRWSRLLATAGWDMTCTDINPEVLAVCQRRVPTASCVLVSPHEKSLPCENEAVRLVLCLEVFPVMNSSWFAAEASRVLSDNGVLVGVVLNRMSLRGLYVRARHLLKGDSDSAFYRLSYAEWRQRAKAAGLEVAFERGYCWFPLPRSSNSILAPFFIKLERWLGLGRLTTLSPWVVFVARRGARPAP